MSPTLGCSDLSEHSKILIVLLLLAPALLCGCSAMESEAPAPSNRMRQGTSGMAPTGLDDRSRQIESNLGVR